MPGNFTEVRVEGDDEVKRWLRSSDREVGDFLYELTDAIIFHAEDRLRAFAPGDIRELVDVDLPHEDRVGAIEGSAGVEPDIQQSTLTNARGGVPGLGSDPADFPYFVEVGTGVFSEGENAPRTPITTIPNSYPMAWEHPPGNFIFAWTIAGQKPQHYGRRAFEETIAWVPGRIELARAEFAAETEAKAVTR